MSSVRLIPLALFLGLTAQMGVQGQSSSPDIYEEAPYFDSSSETTQNSIPISFHGTPPAQFHTIHSDSDVDWGICNQTLGSTQHWVLTIGNPVIPPGSGLLVELYESGPRSPSTKVLTILSGQEGGSLDWWQNPYLEQVYCSVRALGSSSPAMSYEISYASPPGATLPVNPVEERTIHIAPIGTGAGHPVTANQSPAQITPGEESLYALHRVEFPGFALTDAEDPNRIEVTMRSATLFERASPGGGQHFPTQSAALFVIETHSAQGERLAFNDPVNVTVQFVERPNPSETDVVTLDTLPGQPIQMRLVRDAQDGGEVDFQLLGDARESVDINGGLVALDGLVGLTGPDGLGVWGAAVDPAVVVSLDFDDLIGHLIGTAPIPHTYQSQVDNNGDGFLDAADVVTAVNASTESP